MEPGVIIDGEHFPFEWDFALGDAPLVFELCVMEWDEFAKSLDRGAAGSGRALNGMIGIAVWRKHPEWPRSRVVRFVERLNYDQIDFTAGDTPDPPTEAVPPPATSTTGSTAASPAEPEDAPSEPTPAPIGVPT